MDKNIIKRYLTERFVNEVAEGGNTPGISVTSAANKKSGVINKAGVKAIDTDVKNYDKKLKKGESEVKDNKFNYNSTEEMEYHNDMEIMNGQEMIEYDREPNKLFLDKAKEGIEGSSRMGNKGGKGMGNAEESWGASSDNFGKDLVKRVKATTKKRDNASDSVMSFGDDVETVPKGSIPKGKHSAIQENDVNEISKNLTSRASDLANKLKNQSTGDDWTKNHDRELKFSKHSNPELGRQLRNLGGSLSDYAGFQYVRFQPKNNFPEILVKITPDGVQFVNGNKEWLIQSRGQEAMDVINKFQQDLAPKNANINEYNPYGSEEETEFNNDQKSTNNNQQIKESMKRLKFKKEFNGVGNALKMIPESYRTDNKEFEMTDGNESYKIRWEGTLTEGKAVVLTAANKNMINEDMQRMKQLMGYKSQETLGGSKKVNRITENAIFNDILGKTRRLLGENEDIDGQTAPEGEWDDINVPQASDAKKDIEGSTSDDKGTKAPAPKVGEWDDINVPQASDAKKHVEGSVATEAKTNAPSPKEGHWEEISKPQATEAKKDVTMKESDDEIPVNNEDPTKQPGYVHEEEEDEDEEEMVDESIKLMVSESTGKFYIVGATDKPFAIPAKDNAKALKNPKKYISEVFKK